MWRVAKRRLRYDGGGHDDRQNQQICRGHPLDGRCVDPEFIHERGKRDVHGRLDHHVRKRHDAGGDHRHNEPRIEHALKLPGSDRGLLRNLHVVLPGLRYARVGTSLVRADMRMIVGFRKRCR